MLEQPLYYNEPAERPVDRGDLFRGYEIKNWEITPRIYKILAISAIGNILAVLVVAQTSLLTMKGCDSPLVGRVCEVLDTVYVASTYFGTDRDYIDAAYEHTDLGDSEITFIDTTGMNEQPLDYPEGYFQIANPEQFLATAEPAFGDGFTSGIPGIPSGIPMSPLNGGSLLDTAPNIPPANPNAVEGDLPSGFGGSVAGIPGGRPLNRKPRRGGRITNPRVNPPQATPTPEDVAKVEPTPGPTVEPTKPVAGVEINKRPFVDLGNSIAAKKVNLETVFVVSATGKIDKNGKLDPKSFVYTRTESPDPKMIETIKEAVEAMNASGYLQYLTMFDFKNLTFQVQQDDQTVKAMVESKFDNDLRPKTLSTLVNGFIGEKKAEKEKPEADQNDKDDLVLLQNAVATPTGNKLVISFTIPKADLQRMIQRKLAEARATPTPQNGAAVSKMENNTAQK